MPRDRQRKKEWNRQNRERYNSKDRNAGYPRQARYRRNQRAKIRDRANERNFRMHQVSRKHRLKLWAQGLSIINPGNPPLLYIDPHGQVWKEDTRSAEQLIADYQRERSATK
jgi:hypothetical protein